MSEVLRGAAFGMLVAVVFLLGNIWGLKQSSCPQHLTQETTK